jgi:hypothetical protein
MSDDIVKKYESLGGLLFRRKDGKGLTVKVNKYCGIHIVQGGIRAHLIEVEATGQARWTPIASKFLEEYEQIEK